MKRAAVALLSLMLLAGCGSGGSSYKTVQDIRDALAKGSIACEEYKQNTDVLVAKEDGSCKIDGETASLTIWNSDKQRDQIREATAAFQSGFDVDGDGWSVNHPVKETADKIAKAIGGTVK